MDKFNTQIPNPQGQEPKHTPPVPPVQPPVAPIRQPVYQQPPQGYYYPPQPGAMPPTPKPPKKKKSKVPTVIAIILVLITIVAIFGVAWSSKNESGSITGNKPSTTQKNKNNDADDAGATIENSNSEKEAQGKTVAAVTKNCIDSCVLISVYSTQNSYYPFGNGSNSSGSSQLSGEGSGVIMSEANGKTYIMTAAHVISGADGVKITTNDDKEYQGKIVGFDSQTDIGVVSIDATGLKVAKFGNSDQIQVGEQCVIIGCPGGSKFMNSVATGIVSALDRPVSSSIGYNNECIQTDAAINPGNSGGAMFNLSGQVIGINSSKIASTEYEGMGFAVPSNTAVETANSLIKNGYVKGRAKLGIQYTGITNVSNANAILAALEQKGFKDAQGAMIIAEIDERSDLNNKNVKQYDIIVAVNGKTMTSTDVLTSTLSKSSPGDTVKLTIARVQNNQIKTFEVSCKLIEEQ